MCFGLYTVKYENTEQIFYAPVDRDFYHAVIGADGIGMDDADYVHDEIPVELRRGINQFFGTDHFNGAVYHVYYYPVRHIYRGYFCVQQINI